MTNRKAKSETIISPEGSVWLGKNGITRECFAHSLRINDRDLRTSATDMSCMADVVGCSFFCIKFVFLCIFSRGKKKS